MRLEGSGRVELALHPGGYVRFGEEWVLVAIPRAPRGPLTLAVTGLERAPLRVGDEAVVAGGSRPPALYVGALCVDLSGLAPPFALAPPPLSPGWRTALTAALEAAPPVPPELISGLAALRKGELTEALLALAGRGEGLTPAGDDVLAGYAAWRHAEGRPEGTLIAERCSPLGLAYLRCAVRGELPEAAAAVLRAVRGGDADAARRRARGLSRWGASSGHAILWGMAAGACS
ncbi:MAG TPA: DUF2877 domain-containing protein [Solirubrobacter sp.]|nr:DUF2877 domain-containing protein [Solirubrobacter sp.]